MVAGHMNTMSRAFSVIALILSLTLSAHAQAANSLASLPPALRAAVQSGNAQAITQAINTLSGGNPQRSATLACLEIARD
jgi:hypothetical protein